MTMNVCRSVAFAFVLAFGSTALAQGVATGSIAGVVRDTSGGVLPGVTVEASSPALIEKSRTAITDDQGAYKLVDLRSGAYTVTFTLSGFAPLRREGLELTSNFTAPLSIELKVGTLEETVTVSGQSPVVDTQNTVQQRVFAKAVLDALPVGQSFNKYTTLIPGAVGTASSQDVGGAKGENSGGFRIHGSRNGDYQQLRDGMFYGYSNANQFMSSNNPATIQEVAVETSGYTAEAETGAGHINVIPRDGGNVFNGSFKADYGNNSLQGNNITPELAARGARLPSAIRQLYEVGGGVGGPIKRDKLWFFAGMHYWVSSSFQAGNYFNKKQGTLFYEPDLSRPAYDLNYYPEAAIRMTWQAAPKHKITGSYADTRGCNCFWAIGDGTRAPEATMHDKYDANWRSQWTWSFPATSRLLFWAGGTVVDGFINRLDSGGTPDDYSVLELSRNYHYGASGMGFGITTARGKQRMGQANGNFRVQYVTGSHAFKAGLTVRQGWAPRIDAAVNHDVTYIFLNEKPNQVVYWATPFTMRNSYVNSALSAEDQWTVKRVTLNLGLRYDGMVGSVPEQHLPAGPWVPARDFAPVKNVPNWKDIDPRFGVAYDLRGNGKTAVKAALGRYVLYESNATVDANDPVNQMVTSANRLWNDSNGDYIPQESELGALSNASFGKVVLNTTYDDRVLRGWGARRYSWQGLISVQHELAPSVALNVGYFRTWYGNFTVTDNTLVGPADYDAFCITAPTDPRLPNSGQPICGLYDIKPGQFGQVQNLVRPTSDFGTAKDIFNGVDVTLNARLKGGIIVAGGLSTGSETTDFCFTVDSPGTGFVPDTRTGALLPGMMYQCHIAPPWSAGTQIKLSAVVPLPYAFQMAANWQSLPPVPTTASYVATNAESLPSLGRDLGVCRGRSPCTGTSTIELIQPQSYFTEPRNNQVDVRLTRIFKVGHVNVQPEFSAYNVLNAGSVLALNTRYSRTNNQWQNTLAVLAPRLVRFGVQLNF